jgi:hypothetical protein
MTGLLDLSPGTPEWAAAQHFISAADAAAANMKARSDLVIAIPEVVEVMEGSGSGHLPSPSSVSAQLR